LNELELEIKNYSKNYIINQYFYEKEIKQNRDSKIWFVEIGNTNNLSGYIIIKSNGDSISASKKVKQSKIHYVEVVFAGLRQPTKKIHMSTYNVLTDFIKRFKVSYVDVCFDGENKNSIDSKMYYSHVFRDYLGSSSEEKLVGTTFYINNPSAPNTDADYFIKVMVYDKYIKECRNRSHNTKLSTELQYWKRIEFRVRLDMKLKETDALTDYLYSMLPRAKDYFQTNKIEDNYFKQQVKWLTDKRTQGHHIP